MRHDTADLARDLTYALRLLRRQPRFALLVTMTMALGISATTLLGRTASISSMRGTFHDFHGIPLVVTYHPAALLRDPKWKRPTWEDVQMLKARYDQLTGAASSTDG